MDAILEYLLFLLWKVDVKKSKNKSKGLYGDVYCVHLGHRLKHHGGKSSEFKSLKCKTQHLHLQTNYHGSKNVLF